MSNSRKISIAIGAVAALCLCAGAVMIAAVWQVGVRVQESLKTDPTSIAAIGDRIAEYDVPDGYRETMGFSLLTYDTIYILPVSGTADMMIVMMQFTQSGSADSAQMQRAVQQQTGRSTTSTRIVENRSEIIRGQEVTITISESAAEGLNLVQWLTVFRGDHGPTMLMISGPESTWDEDLAANFIHSIR